MDFGTYVFYIILFINALFIIYMIFSERKRPEVIVSWLLLFTFIPIVGFILYVLIGSGLSFKNKRMLKQKKFYDDHYESFYKDVEEYEPNVNKKKNYTNVRYNLENAKSVATNDNEVEFFTTGQSKFKRLLKDIISAKKSINIEYYIFADDFIGKEVMRLLCEKAKAGVKVKLIYDSVGCLGTPRRFFRQLKKVGGEVKEFFPPLFHIRLINLKMNYRNHRKIIVIDGKIAYIGGINLRKDHFGFKKKVSPWRDTHIRVKGQAVYAIQNTFLNFWQFCTKKRVDKREYIKQGYFPKISSKGNMVMQVITSGPNEEENKIKSAMVKLITSAEKEIVLISPYFVPDDIFVSALKQAINSGVKVKIMLPNKPDKKFIYLISLSFIKDFVTMGAEVYLYKGFVHSKVLIIDKEIMLIGTANVDYRSFALNFEISAILYDKVIAKKYLEIVNKDIENSVKLDMAYYAKKTRYNKFWQVILRLFAPLA